MKASILAGPVAEYTIWNRGPLTFTLMQLKQARTCIGVSTDYLRFTVIVAIRGVLLLQWPAMHSHHSHSGQFCRHAKDDLEEIILRAIEIGFKTFGLSEHAPRYRLEDLFPEEVSYITAVRVRS